MTDVMKMVILEASTLRGQVHCRRVFNGVAFYPARFLPKKASIISSIQQA